MGRGVSGDMSLPAANFLLPRQEPLPAAEADHTHRASRSSVPAALQSPMGSEPVLSIPGSPAIFLVGKLHTYTMCLIDSIYTCLYLHIPIFTTLTVTSSTSKKELKGSGYREGDPCF